MPRPKSYDRQEAIAKACVAFWEHGFQALGVRELEQLTGINQFAIRSEFGGKEGLYLEAIRYYSDTAIEQEMAPMLGGGIAEIVAFFQGLVTPGSMTSSDFGCLIVNTGIENARVKSARLETAVNTYWSTLENHFKRALENDRVGRGETTQNVPSDLAKALVTAVLGVHAQNRTQGDQRGGRELVELVCAMLWKLRPINKP